MRSTIHINGSQFDTMPVVVLPRDRVGPAVLGLIPVGTEVHVFTDAELRARDERIIRAMGGYLWDRGHHTIAYDIDAIIAGAEADQ